MTKLQSKNSALIKWDYARETGCTKRSLMVWLNIAYPEIFAYSSGCSFCEKYHTPKNGCSSCSLYKLWGIICGNYKSLYRQWEWASTIETRKKYAELIYQDIKRT